MLPIDRIPSGIEKPKRNSEYERGLKDEIIWVVKNAEAHKPEFLAVNMVDDLLGEDGQP